MQLGEGHIDRKRGKNFYAYIGMCLHYSKPKTFCFPLTKNNSYFKTVGMLYGLKMRIILYISKSPNE